MVNGECRLNSSFVVSAEICAKSHSLLTIDPFYGRELSYSNNRFDDAYSPNRNSVQIGRFFYEVDVMWTV